MTPEKLKSNFKKLRSSIARKTIEDDPNSVITSIQDTFSIYTRTHLINLLNGGNDAIWEASKWPFPAYTLGNRWINFKLLVLFVISTAKMSVVFFFKGLFNKEFKDSIKPRMEYLYKEINFVIINLFALSKSNIFSYWKSHPLLIDKKQIINEINFAYRNKKWYLCIVSATPILDLLCRKYFNSNKLDRDITHLLTLFKSAGIYSIDVKPGHIAWDNAKNKGEDPEKAMKEDLRTIGVALGSFLDFASIYYDWYRKNKNNLGANELNRHAIIHCSSQNIWTKENAIKILTFIDLTLRLEPVFKILLKSD